MNTSLDEARQLLTAGERDRISFLLLLRTGEAPHETLGFLAQQACEKFIKAVMVRNVVKVARTHDLEYLIELAAVGGVAVPIPAGRLRQLTPYAVAFRYESAGREWVSQAEARDMVEALHQWACNEVSTVTGGPGA